MEDTDCKIWIGKRIFLITKTDRRYVGIVKTFDSQHLSMTDKYDHLVIISTSEISSMQEEEAKHEED